MSKKALEDTKYELIKAHILDPDSSPLSYEKQEQLERVIDASKILDKNPIQKHAVNLHRMKYSHISQAQAYEDVRIAVRLFNSVHTFDYDMWRTWLLNDIISNIEKCRNKDTHQDRKIIAMEHANLLKVIGEKPEEIPDPERNEKHQFYILIQNDNRQLKIELNGLQDLPTAALQELNRAIYGGKEITEADVEELMKS